jgi:dipeptidyl-peptidase-4
MRKHLILLLIAFIGVSTTSLAQQKLSLDKIWYSNEFRSNGVASFNSMNDGANFTRLEKGSINIYSYETNLLTGTFVTEDQLRKMAGTPVLLESYAFSADETKLLIASNSEGIYRHSSRSNYFIYDSEAKTVEPLDDPEKGKQRLAEFSPNGDMVAFVRKNNLFVKHLRTGTIDQVTKDGVMNEIINGGTDWVYEEEFGFDKGFYWSPQSNNIAFYKFDESHVKQFQMATYGSLYPDQYTFKYPKAGEANAHVSIHIYDVRDKDTRPCDIGTEKDQYIPRIKWTESDSKLCILRMNRLQNKLEFLVTYAGTPKKQGLISEAVYVEKSDTYVEITDNMIFLEDGSGFLWTSEEDGYNHIYKIGFDGTKKQITKGEWDVVEFKGMEQKTGYIYYTSSEPSAMQRDVFRVKVGGKGKEKLSTRAGQNNAEFSDGMKYYVNTHSDANTPPYISLHDASGKMLHVLVDNADLKKHLAGYGINKKEFFKFKTSENVELNGWMIKPPNFDSAKKYPVFMMVYGGPGINTVNDSWGYNPMIWHHYLAQEGYIVVSVDGRGTGYRGAEFKKCTYQQLGKYETEDQIEAAKWLQEQAYVDPARIGIQGWSYGGYMSLLCMTKGADVFKMGIAVAPVSNWRFYDSIYTERYMRKPQDNADGYDDNSPINHVDKLKGPMLVVHGSSDDNVHFQNSMEIIAEMISQNKAVDFEVYPNKNHGIYGGKTRLHLFNKMTSFILENL